MIIGLDNEELPYYYDLRVDSNTADDFAMFLSLAVAYGFLKRGDILVYDNASVHFGGDTMEELDELFQQHGIETRCLPTYSPELNPIERCFCVIKTYLRYNRDTSRSLLDDIIQAFALLDHELIAKEYLRSAEYLLIQPFTLPPNLQAILDLPDFMDEETIEILTS